MGIILDKEVAHSGMPKRVEEARIALVSSALEIEKTEFDAKTQHHQPCPDSDSSWTRRRRC